MEELVSYESASRTYKRVVLTMVVLLILAVAAIVGLTYAIVSVSQPMKTENGVLMSSSGQPIVVGLPYLTATVQAPNQTATDQTTHARRSLLNIGCTNSLLTMSTNDLTAFCQQMVTSSQSTGVVYIVDTNCNSNACFTQPVTIVVSYSKCLLLTNQTTTTCLPGDVYDSDGNAVYTIIKGTEYLDGTPYQIDLKRNCNSSQWQSTATFIENNGSTCGGATVPPSINSLPPSPAMASNNITKCANGTFWDYTTSECTANPKIDHCTDVKYKDAYTPDCQACEEFFVVSNGMCACNQLVTYQVTSSGGGGNDIHCVCVRFC